MYTSAHGGIAHNSPNRKSPDAHPWMDYETALLSIIIRQLGERGGDWGSAVILGGSEMF